MKKEFEFMVTGDKESTLYRAIEVVETGVYRIEWDSEDDSIGFTHYLPEYVENYLDKGDWVVVE